MPQEKSVKPLKYSPDSQKGLSAKQLSEHHDVLYAGYVKKTNEIRNALETTDLSTANGVYSDLRELKVEETFAVNGYKLHEGYFDNLGGNGTISGQIQDMITRDFGSFEKWEAEFRALGLASRGWVVLAYDLDEKRLMNIVCDAHNQGGIWNAVAVLILDVYEHAYFLDYATQRKAYIETFMKLIDWNHVNELIKKCNIDLKQ